MSSSGPIASSPDVKGLYMSDLEKVVVRDEATKSAVFDVCFSAYTKNPLNLFLRGPSSIGKTYIVIETVRYFPGEHVMLLGGLSPTALVHDYGIFIDPQTGEEFDPAQKPKRRNYLREPSPLKSDFGRGNACDEDAYREAMRLYRLKKAEEEAAFDEARTKWNEKLRRSYYLVDLSHKILVFLEAPNPGTYMKLRPILSHDAPEISFKFTDRPGGGSLRTVHVVLRGWPATIFCTTDMKYVEELATRSFTLTPEMSVEKYREVIELQGRMAAYPMLYERGTPEFTPLRERLEALSMEVRLKNDVILPFGKPLSRAFHSDLPRDMRDHSHLQSLIEISALLNLHNRPVVKAGDRTWIVAVGDDLRSALRIYGAIERTTRAGVSGNVIKFFDKVVLPLWRKVQMPLTYKEIMQEHNRQNPQNPKSTRRVAEYIDLLREIGWIDTERDEVDKRRNLVSVIKGGNTAESGVAAFQVSVTEGDVRNWLNDLEKYIPKRRFYYENLQSTKCMQFGECISYLATRCIGIFSGGHSKPENRVKTEKRTEITATPQSAALQEQLNLIPRVVEEAQFLTGMAKAEEVLNLLREFHGIDPEEGKKLLKISDRDGLIFSPRPGYYKLAVGSKIPSGKS